MMTPSSSRFKSLNALVSHVLVDNGSGVSVFFKNAAKNMGILNSINKSKTTLHTFNWAPV